MKLFQPDIFSVPFPAFVTVTDDVFSKIGELLEQQYDIKTNAIRKIEQVKGNEINSNNFKVETDSMFLFVKRNVLHDNIYELTRMLDLTNWLQERMKAFFKIIPCNNGSLVSQQGRALWSVSEFIPGRYFSGESIDELKAVGHSIGGMHDVVRDIPSHLCPKKKIKLFPIDSEKIIDETFSRREEWVDVFGEDLAPIIEDNTDLMLSTCALINSNKETIFRRQTQTCHIDLHPHNIFVNDGVIHFIDLDSLVLTKPCVAIGFSIYKLMKQYSIRQKLVDNPSKIAEDARGFLFSLQEKFAFSDEEIRVLYLSAIAEIFRRILIILRLSLYENNKCWNFVLPIHLSGIKETEIIFSAIK